MTTPDFREPGRARVTIGLKQYLLEVLANPGSGRYYGRALSITDDYKLVVPLTEAHPTPQDAFAELVATITDLRGQLPGGVE